MRLTLQSITVDIPVRFHEGHTCTAAEAAALQQAMINNLRNNFNQKLKSAEAKGEPINIAEWQARIVEYAKNYTFGRSPNGDPIYAEALRMARIGYLASLRRDGIDPDTIDVEEALPKIIETNPRLLDEAKTRLEMMRSIAIEGLGL